MLEQVRLGFIGAGGIARSHLRRLEEIPEAQVVALAEPSAEALERVLAERPDLASAQINTDYRHMLETAPIDAVLINTPHTQHLAQATEALQAGKHVLVEKPMVCSVAHAHQLMAAQGDRVLMVSYQRHFQGTYRYIRDQVQRGNLGELQFVAALQSQNWLRPTRGTWRQDPALSGGGQLNDSGSHLVDILLWTTGLAAESVYADINRHDAAVDIDSALTLRFGNGARGTLSIIGDSPMWWEEFSLWGSEGTLLYRNGVVYRRRYGESEMTMVEPSELPPDSTPDRNFVDAILGRDKVQAPAECGLRVIELTEAAWRSAERGRPVRISEL